MQAVPAWGQQRSLPCPIAAFPSCSSALPVTSPEESLPATGHCSMSLPGHASAPVQTMHMGWGTEVGLC